MTLSTNLNLEFMDRFSCTSYVICHPSLWAMCTCSPRNPCMFLEPCMQTDQDWCYAYYDMHAFLRVDECGERHVIKPCYHSYASGIKVAIQSFDVAIQHPSGVVMQYSCRWNCMRALPMKSLLVRFMTPARSLARSMLVHFCTWSLFPPLNRHGIRVKKYFGLPFPRSVERVENCMTAKYRCVIYCWDWVHGLIESHTYFSLHADHHDQSDELYWFC